MLKIKIISAVVWLSVCASFCQAFTNYYVVPPPNAGILSPYTNWVMAATNIQDAINLSIAGDTIYITNGYYYLTNYISVGKAITIRSFNSSGITDPINTIIDGNNYTGKSVTNSCLYISADATVDGFTLTNGVAPVSGNTWGGGCKMTTGLLTNCIVTGNTTAIDNACGGGISMQNGGTVANCQIIGNRTKSWGGGVYVGGGVLKNSFIGWNRTDGAGATNNFYNSLCKTVELPPAQGNIQSDPIFVNFNSGNYRLVRGSLCINAGANQAWMPNSFDLDSRRRLDKFSGLVDMGCYEFIPNGTLFTIP